MHTFPTPSSKRVFTVRQFFTVIFTFSLLLLFNFPVTAVAKGDETDVWTIHSFDTAITLTSQDEILVTESISAEFFQQRHGIFRMIPVKYRGINSLDPRSTIDIDVLSVEDGNGNSWNYEASRVGDYLEIKIGDADQYVFGDQVYVISYKADRAISFYDDHDELYWDSTGDQWPVVIERSSATITIPEGIDATQVQSACYIGVAGSTESCSSVSEQNGSYLYTTGKQLLPGEGLTIVLGIPKGHIEEPTLWQRYAGIIFLNSGILLPIPAFIILLFIWKKYGKDAPGRGTIVPEFNPPTNLTPGEAGTLFDNDVQMRDISATLIDLAVRGYIKIEEVKKGLLGKQQYIFHLNNNDLTELRDHEIEMIRGLFGNTPNVGDSIKLSDLKNKFYIHAASMKEQLYKSLVEKGLFSRNPTSLKVIMVPISGIIGVGMLFFLGPFLFSLGAPLTAVGIFITGALIGLFGLWMSQRTKEGSIMLEYIKGLRLYIDTAETERIAKMQSPDSSAYAVDTASADGPEPRRTVELFEKLLPYAMIFGLEKKWAEKFKDIYTQPPDWYSGSSWTTFNTIYFINSLSAATSSMNQTFTSSPRSSGSGFGGGGGAGGGGGGGGGGSW